MVAPLLVLPREFCSRGFEIIDTQLAQAWPRGECRWHCHLPHQEVSVVDLHAIKQRRPTE